MTSNSIGRYFMVSFVYFLNKQLNPMPGRRGRSMIKDDEVRYWVDFDRSNWF